MSLARDKPDSAETGLRSDAERIQFALNRLAVHYREIPFIKKVEEYFSDVSIAALKAYQTLFDLPVSGEEDSLTLGSITYAVSVLGKYSADAKKQACSQNNPFKVLIYGDVGVEVIRLQHYINTAVRKLGASRFKPVNMSGRFDEQTWESVASFQRLKGLPQSGTADRKTWIMLTKCCADYLGNDGKKKEYPGSALRVRSRGENVLYIQYAVNAIKCRLCGKEVLDTDGVFGAETEGEVRRLQRLFGLAADGVVGASTWNAIMEEYGRFGIRAEG